MRERPILFSGPMVRAILEGRKTQTRRVIKPQPDPTNQRYDYNRVEQVGKWFHILADKPEPVMHTVICPQGIPGDQLWVREAWLELSYNATAGTCPLYRADGELKPPELKWRPSIHMPRFACRIVLEVTDVRVQRLQEITESDAEAEGLTWPADLAFPGLWDSINAKRGFGWDTNPWVWALTFKRLL